MAKKQLNQKHVAKLVRDMGLTYREKDGEIRVNYRGTGEDTAYYTNDRADALQTAAMMKTLKDSSKR